MKKHGTWILAAVLLATPLLAQENTPELLAWWMFNEEDGGTALLDLSGNDFYAEILAPDHVWRVVDPVVGTALWFDGTGTVNDPLTDDEHVIAGEIADQLFEPEFSVSTWVCLASVPDFAPVITKVTDRGTWLDGFGIFEDSGRFKAFVNGYGFLVMEGGESRANTWTHLCLTFDGETAKFYVNGQLRSTVQPGTDAVVNDAPMRFGTMVVEGMLCAWHGAIADARVYASALSAADVMTVFTSSPASAIADSDGDGMPDLWELRFGLNPLNPADAGQVRHVSDGFTNLQKYRLGMNPSKAAVTASEPLLKVYTPMEK